MPRLKSFLLKLHAPIWMGVLIAIVLILRIPSFFEPYYYGDEMIYMALGQGLRQGISLYSGLFDNKPPLIYLLAALAGNLFWFKVILASFNIASIIFFWKLTEALFPKKIRLHQVSIFIFGLLTTLPLLEGNTVNAELLMVAPILAAFYLVFVKKNLFLAGILFGLAALFKIPAAFEFPVIFVYWIFTSSFKLKRAFFLTLGFLLPLGLSFIWFFISGAGKDYLLAAFLQNVGYVSSWAAVGPSLPWRGAILIVLTSILFLLRKRLSKQFLFLCTWLIFCLFAITLSARPYPHYLIQALPATAILFGMLITEKTLEQSLTVIPLSFFFLVPFFYNFWTYPTTAYYQRFVDFASGQTTKDEYFNKFDGHVNRNYELAKLVESSTMPGQKIFVWGGDSPTIYSLSRRLPPIKYVADYHIVDYANYVEVAQELNQKSPELIIVLPEAKPFLELREIIKKNYILVDNTNLAEVWRLSK